MSNKKRAFTLIELLVVIAIIAILAAILFPVFAQAKLSAKKAADLSNMKQLGLAAQMYINDYDDNYFVSATYIGSPQPYGAMYRWSSDLCLGPYIKNHDIFASPVDTKYTVTLTGGWAYALPVPSTRIASPISYMANGLSNIDIGAAPSPYFPATVTDFTGPVGLGSYYGPSNPASVSATAATSPATLILFTGGSIELSTWWGGTGCANATNTETIPGCYNDADLQYGWDVANLASGTSFGGPDVNMAKAWRKVANSSNFAFSDGHAKTMHPGELMLGALVLNPKYWLVNSAGF